MSLRTDPVPPSFFLRWLEQPESQKLGRRYRPRQPGKPRTTFGGEFSAPVTSQAVGLSGTAKLDQLLSLIAIA